MILGRFAAVLDACTLHPAFLRASLLWLADDHLFRPLWSPSILEEYRRSLLRRFGDDQEKAEKAERLVAVMDTKFPFSQVTPPQSLIAALDLPDADDNHVLATAITAKADAIITYNIKDFPTEKVEPFGIEIVHPDQFMVNLIDLDQERALACLRRQREQMKNPPYTPDDFLQRYQQSDLIQTVARLSDLKDLL